VQAVQDGPTQLVAVAAAVAVVALARFLQHCKLDFHIRLW
jgi:hypothetical protein